MTEPVPFHLVRDGETRDGGDAELLRLRAELESRNRQEIAMAELGQAALTGVDPLILLGQACALVELTLQVSHCRALELTPGGPMHVRAALGANVSFAHCTLDADEDESLAMVTLLADAPFAFPSLEEETRFKATHLRDHHHVRAGAAVTIRTQYGPFGIIAVYSDRERTFAEYELAFLRATANIVGEAISRTRTENELRHELEQRERRFRTIVEKSWSGVVLLDGNLRFSFTGSSTHHLIGYPDEELLGRELLEFVHPHDHEAARKVFDGVVVHPNHEAHGELRFRHKEGHWVWLEGFCQNLLHEPSVNAIVLNYRDVSQRKETEKQLEYRAYYDSLTGLPNRLLFRDRLVNSLASAKRNRVGVAVMYLDVDHFKLVNDGLGHSFGDLLLADIARRLHGSLRASDTISRIGGDEFSILLPEVTSTDAVAGVARKILDSLTRPFNVEGHDLFVTASLGISCYPSDGDDAETLLKCADAAMYRAKELGRNQAQLFTASMNERYVRRLALEQHLHHAIERNQLELYYQPLYDRARRQIVSLEALLRWRDPVRGIVAPSEFIQLAEETGMIIPIGEWVLRDACRQLREWHEQGLPALRVAVNISAVQLQQRGFAELVHAAIAESGISPHMLQLEITESAAMLSFEQTMKVLREIREMGVSLAVDDFGTGQSSLIYLKHFPIDTVKIDKEFLRDVTSDETAAAIVAHVINLAHTLQLKVVAEGVETEEQYTFLRHYACDLMQGYLFSPPLPAAEVLPYLRTAFVGPKTLEFRRPEV
ncbi:MAG TPA: EAL domain-containing protein [Thermoanaerobaculia bacterium]|nr:EAL domain-containing protein [Thermoanaerobaculia bacterium]